MHPQQNIMANGLTGNELIQCPMAISANGNFYSVSSLDGQLHIWDTLSADLISDYTPSAHLSATCVRLSWPPLSSNSNVLSSPTKRRKKLKSNDQDVQNEIDKLQLVALGTANGTILLYSVTKSELYSQLANGHSDRVNDIAWNPASDSLFSCSNDKYVIEWSISKSSIKSKHMLDRSVGNSIAVIDSKNILTASNCIKWWNWETKQLLKTFSGHSTEVKYLKPITFGPVNEYNILLSTAISDRYINAWELNESKNSNSVASFALDDEPISLELAYTSSNNSAYILSISRRGFFYIFEHLFGESVKNSRGSKTNGTALTSPIVPKIKLQINATLVKNVRKRNKKSSADSMRQIPFLCAHLNSEVLPVDSESNNSANNFFLMIGYGNISRPVFERISYSDCEKCYLKDDGVLERTEIDTAKIPSIVDESNKNTKIKSNQSAKATEKTTVIGPAGIVSSQPLFNNISNKNGNKLNGDINSDDDEEEEDEINNNYIEVKSSPRKSTDNKSDKPLTNDSKEKKKPSKGELTLGEQLAQISEEEKVKRQTRRKKRKQNLSESIEQANTDSLVNVLMQGLKSQDTKMLQTVLNSPEEAVIQNTIKKLPVSYIPLLMTELQSGLFKNGDHQSTYLKWISLVMQGKISHLMSANVSNAFFSLNQLLTARTAILDRCYQLKGRLDIMLSQIKSDKRTEKLTRTQPKLTYESDSSESDVEMNNEDEEEDDEEQDVLSMDDHDLMNTDEDDDDDEELHDEEMYQSANEDDDDVSDKGRSKINSTDMDADDDSDEDDDDD